MFPDAYILERRLRQLERLPWPIPAAVIMRMTDEDLDNLAGTPDRDGYWHILNGIVARIQTNNDKEVSA
jgi:hypothetical protein